MKKTALLLALILSLSMVFSGCAKAEPEATTGAATEEATTEEATTEEAATEEAATTEAGADEEIVVGFIFSGPINDGGYVETINDGRVMVEEELGVKTMYKESVPESQEVEKVAKDMISEGANVIFACSFGYMDYIENVSKEFPDVKFYHSAGFKSSENFINYFARIEHARYLTGIVAGLKTETDQIGYVAAFEIAQVIRGINAFTLGVQSVNPDAVVNVKWTHTWYDPAVEKEAAMALIDEGSDVIAQHQNSAGAQQAAEEAGVFSIGYNGDMSASAPKANMTSAVFIWGAYFVDQVKKIQEGTWVAENFWGGLESGVVDIAPLTANAPEGAQEAVDSAKAAIIDGSLNVFAGPIYDQAGELRVAEGAVMTDEEQLNTDWFVKGVNGKIEK